MNIDYAIMSTDKNPLYDNFWELVSGAWKNRINVTPILVIIGEKEDIQFDSDKVIVELKTVEGIPTSHQAQIARLYATKYFPKKTIITSDIDMLPISKEYFWEPIKNLSDDSLYMYACDSYLSSQTLATWDYSFYTNLRNIMCYNIMTSETYNEILDLNVSFTDFTNRLMTYNLGWNTDEVYLGNAIKNFQKRNEHRVYSTFRGLEYNISAAHRRIDREHMKHFDLEKLKNGHYVDFHFPRPYKEHKEIIDFIIDNISRYIP